MQTIVPRWARRGCPLLPESLRNFWSGEVVPPWVTEELGLAEGADFASLGVQAWAMCSHDELPESVQRFLINVVAMRRAVISDLRVFVRPWPRSLDPSLLSWSNRTRNCLQKAGVLSDVSRLSTISFGDLLSIPALGAVSVLDFSCVAEA